MEEEDAKQLVREAIRAGIFYDMGSGSYVDLVVIKANDNVRTKIAYVGLCLKIVGLISISFYV